MGSRPAESSLNCDSPHSHRLYKKSPKLQGAGSVHTNTESIFPSNCEECSQLRENRELLVVVGDVIICSTQKVWSTALEHHEKEGKMLSCNSLLYFFLLRDGQSGSQDSLLGQSHLAGLGYATWSKWAG